MPSGQVHHEYWKRDLPYAVGLGVVLFVVGLFKNLYLAEFAVWFVFWYWMGRYIDPDLDLPGVTQAEGRMLRELGLLGVLLFAGTSLYAALIAWIMRVLKIKGNPHRSKLTHSIVPGTIIRAGMINVPIYALVDMFGQLLLRSFEIYLAFAFSDILAFILAQVAGLGVSDLRHISLDKHYKGDEE
jgi:uncharacterized metal-binding protein